MSKDPIVKVVGQKVNMIVVDDPIFPNMTDAERDRMVNDLRWWERLRQWQADEMSRRVAESVEKAMIGGVNDDSSGIA